MLKFEDSISHDPKVYDFENAFVQIAFDDADYNTNTLDGYNTFYLMCGISIVTLSDCVTGTGTTKRLKKQPRASTVGKFGFVQLKSFKRGFSRGLWDLAIHDWRNENIVPNASI